MENSINNQKGGNDKNKINDIRRVVAICIFILGSVLAFTLLMIKSIEIDNKNRMEKDIQMVNNLMENIPKMEVFNHIYDVDGEGEDVNSFIDNWIDRSDVVIGRNYLDRSRNFLSVRLLSNLLRLKHIGDSDFNGIDMGLKNHQEGQIFIEMRLKLNNKDIDQKKLDYINSSNNIDMVVGKLGLDTLGLTFSKIPSSVCAEFAREFSNKFNVYINLDRFNNDVDEKVMKKRCAGNNNVVSFFKKLD